jgi:hypothetical protein
VPQSTACVVGGAHRTRVLHERASACVAAPSPRFADSAVIWAKLATPWPHPVPERVLVVVRGRPGVRVVRAAWPGPGCFQPTSTELLLPAWDDQPSAQACRGFPSSRVWGWWWAACTPPVRGLCARGRRCFVSAGQGRRRVVACPYVRVPARLRCGLSHTAHGARLTVWQGWRSVVCGVLLLAAHT